MKFAHKIVISASLILTLSLALLSTNQYLQVKEEVDNQVTNSVNELVASMSKHIEEVMSTKGDITAYAVSLLDGDFSEEKFQQVFNKPVIKKHFLLAGMGIDSDGSWVGNDTGWNPGSSFDPRQRMWYQEAKKQNQILFTAPYADAASGEIMISTAAPLNANGQFEGAIFTDVSLKGLAEISNSANLFGAGYAFIVGSDGKFIAHPKASLNGKAMSELFGTQLNVNDKKITMDVGGTDSTVIFQPMAGLGWHLGVVLENDIIHATVNNLRSDAIMYSIIAVLISVFVLSAIITRLMLPLRILNEAMKDVASGEGDLTRRLSTNSDAEFASLASSFNNFVVKLQEMIQQVKVIGDTIMEGTEKVSQGADSSATAMEQQNE